jgi:hypothetical protein
MLKIAFLSTSLYFAPMLKDNGNFGFKYTQRITDAIYFKVRYEDVNIATQKVEPKIKAYFDFDFKL